HSHSVPPLITFPFVLLPLSPSPILLLPSFPTRRSSDLDYYPQLQRLLHEDLSYFGNYWTVIPATQRRHGATQKALDNRPVITKRSEEHTSELQSRFDLVCRLLLEKKKKKPSI